MASGVISQGRVTPWVGFRFLLATGLVRFLHVPLREVSADPWIIHPVWQGRWGDGEIQSHSASKAAPLHCALSAGSDLAAPGGMSLRTGSQLDLHASPCSLGPWKPLSLSSGSVEGRQSRARDGQEEAPAAPRTCRRPVRAVRPVSALSPNASFLQINRLQGELVRKRKVIHHFFSFTLTVLF